MLRETQRPTGDLSAGAGRPADEVSSSRRRFLGGTGLAAVGAAIGSAMPFSENSPPGISVAQAQAPAAPAKGPQYLKFPGKNEGLVVLGDRPLVAETPEHLLDEETTPTAKFFVRNKIWGSNEAYWLQFPSLKSLKFLLPI